MCTWIREIIRRQLGIYIHDTTCVTPGDSWADSLYCGALNCWQIFLKIAETAGVRLTVFAAGIFVVWLLYRRRLTSPVAVLWRSPCLVDGKRDEYEKMIRREIEQIGHIQLSPTQMSSDDQDKNLSHQPILMVVPSITRLAIDVEHAMKNIEYSELVVVMMVHNRAPHVQDLPDSHVMLTTSDRKFSKLGLIVDVIIYDKLLSSCSLNTKSLTRVAKYVKDLVKT